MTDARILHMRVEWFAEHYRGEPFHSILCDPPYEYGFMGKSWDRTGIAYRPDTWAGLAEHLHPGGFGMAFASSRGWHRLAVAIEDAGLIIHPSIFGWAFGSGFPKATRIDTQVDKSHRRDYVEAALSLGLDIPGNNLHDWTEQDHIPSDKWWDKFKAVLSEDDWQAIEREVVGHNDRKAGWYTAQDGHDITAPATDLARQWQGHRYGLQALKPALEPIIVFQKPYSGRPVDNITATGAGALNIDGARIPVPGDDPNKRRETGDLAGTSEQMVYGNGLYNHTRGATLTQGRWPSNLLLLDDGAAAALDKQATGKEYCATCGNEIGAVTPFFAGGNRGAGKSTTSQSTSTSGSSTTDQSQKDTLSTTSTKTRKTIESKTLPALPEPTTQKSTAKMSDEAAMDGSAVVYCVECGSPRVPTTGAARMDGKHGVKSAREISGANGAKRTASTSTPTCGSTDNRPSRFFYRVRAALDDADPVCYTAKASRAEREAGLEGFGRDVSQKYGTIRTNRGNGYPEATTRRNHHPTVKPLDLARYLAGLLLPPEEYAPRRLLVPFCGTASEMIGGFMAGWDEIVGVEFTREYVDIARARLAYWMAQGVQLDFIDELTA